MVHLTLDQADESVKEFVRRLGRGSEQVALELDGQVLCTVVPRNESEVDLSLRDRCRALVDRVRERNRGRSAADVVREVADAVADVRARSLP